MRPGKQCLLFNCTCQCNKPFNNLRDYDSWTQCCQMLKCLTHFCKTNFGEHGLHCNMFDGLHKVCYVLLTEPVTAWYRCLPRQLLVSFPVTLFWCCENADASNTVLQTKQMTKIWCYQGDDLVMTLYSLVVWHIGTHSTWAHRITHGSGVKAWLFNNNTNMCSWKMGRTNQQMQSEGENDIKYWQSKSWPWMWCNDRTVPARERK